MRKQSYHHGHLQEALVNIALKSLEHQRASEISLRKLAVKLEVDHTAVYRHFKNRDALLAAMIEVGYQKLIEMMAEAWQTDAPWRERIKQVVKAYAEYARTNPNLFEIMFGGALDESQYPALQQLSMQSTNMFVTYVKQAQTDGMFTGDEPSKVALNICMLCHGLAQMVVGNQFKGSFAKVDEDLDRLAEGVVTGMNLE
ncbi:MAG: TetR/AcrR family transcriptional regulator [Deinococcota bacterium]